MTALRARDLDAARDLIWGTGPRMQREPDMRVVASGGPDRERAVARPVEVDEQPPRHECGVDRLGAVEALLLRDGEEELERAVLDGRVVRDSQRRGHADAVVRAQRRPVRADPVA